MSYIEKLFEKITDRSILAAINIRNIRNMYVFSIVTFIFDTLSMALFAVTNRGDPEFLRTLINVCCCIVACALVIVLSRAIIRKYEQDGTISNVKATLLVTFFYILLSAWGIIVDVGHYGAQEQMLTFYIVQFCFVCFVVMQPKLGSLLIALSFTALYLAVYFVDGAAAMQPQNYIIFAVIAVLGNAIQHMTLQESERAKTETLELNQILQQEASVDDLTQLKNRKALRNDFDMLIGRLVYTVMADVDNFKSYNDTYGHEIGDKVLRLVASAAAEAFPDGEAYRYGGDEFLIILPDHTEAQLQEKLKKWDDALSSIRIPGVSRSITCSYGYDHRMLKDANDLRMAINTADSGLYKEKKAR